MRGCTEITLGGHFEVKSRLFWVIVCAKRGLEVGFRAVEHFGLPASPANTLGIGSQLSKYWKYIGGLTHISGQIGTPCAEFFASALCAPRTPEPSRTSSQASNEGKFARERCLEVQQCSRDSYLHAKQPLTWGLNDFLWLRGGVCRLPGVAGEGSFGPIFRRMPRPSPASSLIIGIYIG